MPKAFNGLTYLGHGGRDHLIPYCNVHIDSTTHHDSRCNLELSNGPTPTHGLEPKSLHI